MKKTDKPTRGPTPPTVSPHFEAADKRPAPPEQRAKMSPCGAERSDCDAQAASVLHYQAFTTHKQQRAHLVVRPPWESNMFFGESC